MFIDNTLMPANDSVTSSSNKGKSPAENNRMQWIRVSVSWDNRGVLLAYIRPPPLTEGVTGCCHMQWPHAPMGCMMCPYAHMDQADPREGGRSDQTSRPMLPQRVPSVADDGHPAQPLVFGWDDWAVDHVHDGLQGCGTVVPVLQPQPQQPLTESQPEGMCHIRLCCWPGRSVASVH